MRLAGHRLLASLPHRLIFCPIEKVATHQWVQLFLAAIGKPCRDSFGSMDDAQRQRELPMLDAFAPAHRKRMLKCGAASGSARPWIKVVAVRDPLERLLSAFLDKCTSYPANDSHHAMHCISFARTMPSFDEFVRKLTPSSIVNDHHFNLQSNFCQLRPSKPRFSPLAHPPASETLPHMLPEYDVVLKMSEPDFLPQVDALLARVGIDLRLRRRFLPGASAARHRTGAARRMSSFYTRSLAERALRLYRRDYEAFGLRMPNMSAFPRVLKGEF